MMKKKWIAALSAMIISVTMAAPQISLAAQTPEVFQENVIMHGAAASTGAEKDTDGTRNSNGELVTDNGFAYTTDSTTLTATITKYYGTATALTVPASIETAAGTSGTATTYSVTAISNTAFAGNAGLTSVTMQGGTTGTGSGNSSSSTTQVTGLLTIGDRAFYGCPSLTTVTIPATVTSIGNQAFSDCPALTALNVTAGNQRYVSNDGVLYEYVGYNQNSTGSYNTYTLLQYPSGKLSTGYTAPTAIANRLTAIGQGAFAGAQALTSITLPESVQDIGSEAFRNCSALTSMTIPDKVTVIPSYAFSGCSALSSVSIPDQVVTIGECAFQNCYALASVDLPSKLTAINNSTFYGCSKLSEVTIPSSVARIGMTAFAYCASLVKITIPATVTVIDNDAFLGVYGLTIYCHSGSQAAKRAADFKIGTVMTYTVRFLSDTGTLLSSQEIVHGSAATAPTMPERPGYKLKWSCSFSNVTSDLTVTATYVRVYTVTFIDGYLNKTSTVRVEYGKAATAPKWTMSGYTLKWDQSFSNVTGDMTVNAFWKDPATGFIIDKDTVKPAKKNTELKKGTVVYSVVKADPQDPRVRYVSNSNTAAKSVTIPATVKINGVTYKVTRIGDEAFASNTNLTSVTIGSNVMVINSKAFYKCKNLSKVKINSKKISSIGSKAFYGIKNKAMFYAYRSKLKTYQSKIKNSGINTTIQLKAIS